MKIKVVVIALLSSLVLGSAIAQDIEYDDMYFNKNDRAKLQALRASENTFAMNSKKSKRDKEEEMAEEMNPTDSYSARNINPEYTSREQSQTAQEDDEDYFVNNYAYNTQSRYNNWNNNFNNWYNNPWYSSAYWGPSIYSWNTPYYGSYYDMWGSPWANPYYRSGWSSSFSYYWGSRWNYGWGMNYGYGGYMDPFYNSWAYMGPGFSYWSRPNVIIVNNGEGGGRKRVYGKAPSRGTAAIYSNSDSRSRYDNNNNGRANNNGRISTREQVYYNRNWRNTGSYEQQNSSLDSRNNTQYNRSRSWDNNSGNDNSSSWGRSSNNNSSYTPSPSFNNNSGGATRSHGSSTGSGSNGRTRGRD